MSDTDAIIRTIWTALGTVIDPEVGLDIVTMGLVYDVEVDGDSVEIVHTLTSPGCPMGRIIADGIQRAVLAANGVAHVGMRVVWDPSWHPGMIAPGAFDRGDYE